MPLQLLPISTQQNKVVNITQIVAAFQMVFDELIYFIEINIGKELARVVADCQALNSTPAGEITFVQHPVNKRQTRHSRRRESEYRFHKGHDNTICSAPQNFRLAAIGLAKAGVIIDCRRGCPPPSWDKIVFDDSHSPRWDRSPA